MATYNPIQSQTLVSAASLVTFSSFAGYTDLILTINGALTGSAVKYIYFNGSNANLSCVTYTGSGSAVANGYYATGYLDVSNSSSNEFTNIVQIFSYTNARNKTYICNGNAGSTAVEIIAGRWASTAAITSLTIGTTSNNFGIGTTFSLYGILAA